MKRGDELTVRVEDFAFEGKSIARVSGMIVFVREAVPGDVARINLTRVKKHYAEATTVEIMEPSALRAEPRCKYFGTCGGCRWQNVEYGTQLEFKRQHVMDALERIGGFTGIQVRPVLGADRPYFYRNKMEFSFGEPWLSKDEYARMKDNGPSQREPALGLHVAGRYDRVLDIHECWLQSEESNRIVNAVREWARTRHLDCYSTRTHRGYLRHLVIRESERTGERMINLVTTDHRPVLLRELNDHLQSNAIRFTTLVNNITERKSLVAIGEREEVYAGSGFITERLGNHAYRISANSFFQTNTRQAERLYDTALRMAGLTGTEVVYDLYSGTGTIALHFADACRSIVGVESSASAVEDARANASLNGIANCVFVLGETAEVLKSAEGAIAGQPAPDVIVVDPPRSGIHPKALERILEMRATRIVYVSCNPATQARDLKELVSTGRYVVGEVTPVDMFPHTYHVESVVLLQRTE